MKAESAGPAIKKKARDLGFERVGFCDATVPPDVRHFDDWLDAGMHAGMQWMQTGAGKRRDPRRVLPGVRSIIVVGQSYAQPGSDAGRPPRDGGPRGRVARYALGDDYHDVMGERLGRLERFIEREAPGHRALAYVDHGPVLERMWAARAGIGWIGKNSLVLSREMGSFFFLGVILTTLPLPADAPAVDQCGSCALCIEACPTGAIVSPRLVDSRRCISYHTIELRGPIPAEHRQAVGDRVFGCDDCQEACPWNQEGTPAGGAAGAGTVFAARPGSVFPSLLELATMTHEAYLERFRGSAIRRATYRGMRRNAALCAGNAPARGKGGETLRAALGRIAGDTQEDDVVREQAGWSAARLRPDAAGGD